MRNEGCSRLSRGINEISICCKFTNARVESGDLRKTKEKGQMKKDCNYFMIFFLYSFVFKKRQSFFTFRRTCVDIELLIYHNCI